MGAAVGLCAALLIVRRLGDWRPRWAVSASQSVDLALPYDDALKRVEAALGNLSLSEPISRRGHVLKATVRRNWMTYGNAIEVTLSNRGRQHVKVDIASRPVTPQVYDWGRSRSLVGRIAADLTATGDSAGRRGRAARSHGTAA